MSDTAKQVRDCIDDGFEDPELISIRTGLSLSEVEEVLGERRRSRSVAQILQDEIDSLETNMRQSIGDVPGSSERSECIRHQDTSDVMAATGRPTSGFG